MERIGRRLLIVFFVVYASTLLVNATDPPFNVGVCKLEGAPGCELIDGAILVGNQSTTYYYKINMSISCAPIRCTQGQCGDSGTRENLTLAPKFCTPGDNPPCFQQITCLLRNCPSSSGCSGCSTCDNDPGDCGTEDQLCTGVGGGVTGVAWSTDGVNWTNFETQPTASPTEYCSGGNSCQ